MIGNKDDSDFDLQSVDDLTELDLEDKPDNLSALSAGGRKFSAGSFSGGKKVSPVLLAVAGVAVVGAGLLFFMGGGDKPVPPPAAAVMPEPTSAEMVDAQPPVPMPDASMPLPDITAQPQLENTTDLAALAMNDLPQPDAPEVIEPVAPVTVDEVVAPVAEAPADLAALPPILPPADGISVDGTAPPVTPPAVDAPPQIDAALNVDPLAPPPAMPAPEVALPAVPEPTIPAPTEEALQPVVETPVAAQPAVTQEEPVPMAAGAPTDVVAADVADVLEKALAEGGGSATGGLASEEFFDSATLPKLPDTAKPSGAMPGMLSPGNNAASGLVVVTKSAARDSVEALSAAGKRALSLRRYEAALDFYDQLYEKNPDDASVLMGRAVALQNMNRAEEAAVMYDKALAKDPNNPEILLNMLGLLKKQYPAVAYERLKMLRKDYPANSLVAAQLGLAAAEAGDLEEGARNLQVAASLQPNNPQHYFNLGILYERAGKTKDAVLAYEKALEVDAIYGSGRAVSREVIYDRLARLRG